MRRFKRRNNILHSFLTLWCHSIQQNTVFVFGVALRAFFVLCSGERWRDVPFSAVGVFWKERVGAALRVPLLVQVPYERANHGTF
jgi:hypothetical protein